MTNCVYCGEPTEEYEYIGRTKVWHCRENECLQALEDDMHEDYLYEQEELARAKWESESFGY